VTGRDTTAEDRLQNVDCMKRWLVLVLVGVVAGISAGAADAAVFARFLRTEARVGDRAAARVDAWTATHHPPLYLVAATSSTTFTTARDTPHGLPYIRLRHIDWGKAAKSTVRIRFWVPLVKRGQYRLVVFCESCTSGPLGSVIGSVNTLRIR
jgi:hypothetical protein